MKEEQKVYNCLGKEHPYFAVTIENDADKKIIQDRIRQKDERMFAMRKKQDGTFVDVMSTKDWANAKVQVFFWLKELERYLGNGSSMTVASNYDHPFNMYTFDKKILDD